MKILRKLIAVTSHLFGSEEYSAGVFVDLKKAFDTVDHNILLKKADYYGVRGIANEWFASYLKNRKQFDSICGYISSSQVI